MDKKRKIILLIGLLVALIVIIFILISALFSKNEHKEQVQITLPDAEVQDIPRAKIKVYDNGRKPVTNYDEYIRRVTSTDISHADSVITTVPAEEDNHTLAMKEADAARRSLSENIRNARNTALQTGTGKVVEDNNPSGRSTPRISPTTPDNWKERYDYIYERYYREKEKETDSTAHEKDTDTAAAVTAATGFITVVGIGTATATQAVHVATTRETELQSGDKVQLRLLDETTLSGVTLPRNTYIYAIASVSDNRLQLSVSSISYTGGILPCTLSAYDTDGYRGLAFVDSQSSRNLDNEIVSGLSSAASTVAASVSGIASRAISSASRLASKQNQTQQQTVRLPADYQFILR